MLMCLHNLSDLLKTETAPLCPSKYIKILLICFDRYVGAWHHIENLILSRKPGNNQVKDLETHVKRKRKISDSAVFLGQKSKINKSVALTMLPYSNEWDELCFFTQSDFSLSKRGITVIIWNTWRCLGLNPGPHRCKAYTLLLTNIPQSVTWPPLNVGMWECVGMCATFIAFFCLSSSTCRRNILLWFRFEAIVGM